MRRECMSKGVDSHIKEPAVSQVEIFRPIRSTRRFEQDRGFGGGRLIAGNEATIERTSNPIDRGLCDRELYRCLLQQILTVKSLVAVLCRMSSATGAPRAEESRSHPGEERGPPFNSWQVTFMGAKHQHHQSHIVDTPWIAKESKIALHEAKGSAIVIAI